MVPQLQSYLLHDWKAESDRKLLDPFSGSGTSLVEAQDLGMEVVGIDLNPYAIMLSKVKTHDYSNVNFQNLIVSLNDELRDTTFAKPVHSFANISKWFRADIIESLSLVRNVIADKENNWVRYFLWVCMANVIYTHSNDRTSTFKLHVKPKMQIEAINNDVIEDFERQVILQSKKLITHRLPEAKIIEGNSMNILKKLPSSYFDIICTSPPYGENATTVTYGQASILFLKWIEKRDIPDSDKLLETYSIIDSLSLGGRYALDREIDIPSVKNYLKILPENKIAKVKKFIGDYSLILQELSRVTVRDGTLLFTVGNRRVDGKSQPLDLITREIFEKMELD